MNEKEVRKLTKYWLESSKHDYDTMISLFESKRFSDALFYGHIVLEKILKALIIKNTKEYSKPTHNLLVLTQDSKVDFNKDDLKFLAEVSKFNIRTRYPDYKLNFYKICNLKYTKPKLDRINLIYKMLCKILKD